MLEVILRNLCTSTAGPRRFIIAGSDSNDLRLALSELEEFAVECSSDGAVLSVNDTAGGAGGTWNLAGVARLKELFDEDLVPSSAAFFDLRIAIELATNPPDPFFANAQTYVAWKASRPREPHADRPDQWDLQAENGREFVRAQRPEEIIMGRSRECFGNAANVVLASNGRLEYVEGFAGGRGGPGGGADGDFKPHAWVTPSDDRAIDVTWPARNPAPSYFGIVFPDIEAVLSLLEERAGYGLLGHYGEFAEVQQLLRRFPGLVAPSL